MSGRKVESCFHCGDEVCRGKSPRTGKPMLFNLDGSEHWKVCTEEKRAAYSQHKRRARGARISLDRRMNYLID